MEYFAGLDVSMDETHMCVVDRNGGISSGDKTEQLARGNRGGADESTEMAREAGVENAGFTAHLEFDAHF